MESEERGKSRGKKLWTIVRISFMMMKRTLSQPNPILHLHGTIQKRGSKIATKALTCRSNDIHNSFISPRHYEFSCSNTPRRRPSRHHHHHLHHHDLIVAQTVVFDAPTSSLLSPMDGRLKNQVDRDAEEFIKRFYRDQRRSVESSSPSPCRHVWARR